MRELILFRWVTLSRWATTTSSSSPRHSTTSTSNRRTSRTTRTTTSHTTPTRKNHQNEQQPLRPTMEIPGEYEAISHAMTCCWGLLWGAILTLATPYARVLQVISEHPRLRDRVGKIASHLGLSETALRGELQRHREPRPLPHPLANTATPIRTRSPGRVPGARVPYGATHRYNSPCRRDLADRGPPPPTGPDPSWTNTWPAGPHLGSSRPTPTLRICQAHGRLRLSNGKSGCALWPTRQDQRPINTREKCPTQTDPKLHTVATGRDRHLLDQTSHLSALLNKTGTKNKGNKHTLFVFPSIQAYSERK